MNSQLQILAVSAASLLWRLLETKFTVLDSPTPIHCTFSGSASSELCEKVTTVSKLRVTLTFFVMMKIVYVLKLAILTTSKFTVQEHIFALLCNQSPDLFFVLFFEFQFLY